MIINIDNKNRGLAIHNKENIAGALIDDILTLVQLRAIVYGKGNKSKTIVFDRPTLGNNLNNFRHAKNTKPNNTQKQWETSYHHNETKIVD